MKNITEYINEAQTPRAMNQAYRSLSTLEEALAMLGSVKCWDISITNKLRPHISAIYKIKDDLQELIDNEKQGQSMRRELNSVK